jgi:ketosteroid isomerase-like protein
MAASACDPGEGLMTTVIDRLAAAVNAHDLDAVAGLIHEDYRSEQPAHPGRAFTGRAQMLANWEAMLAGIPDFRAEICRSVQDGDTTWTEWRWSGTRSDGQAFEMRGVTLFEITGDQIAAGRLYMEETQWKEAGIEQAVEALSGRRPRSAQQLRSRSFRPSERWRQPLPIHSSGRCRRRCRRRTMVRGPERSG